MIEELISQKEMDYYVGPWPHDLQSRWQFNYYYIGLHGWNRINRRAIWRNEPWGCASDEEV